MFTLKRHMNEAKIQLRPNYITAVHAFVIAMLRLRSQKWNNLRIMLNNKHLIELQLDPANLNSGISYSCYF